MLADRVPALVEARIGAAQAMLVTVAQVKQRCFCQNHEGKMHSKERTL